MKIIRLLSVLFLTSCIVSPPPLTALDASNPWHEAALDMAADWEAHPDLPTLDTPVCRDYVRNVRVVHTTEQEFADHTGYCPMTEHGCSTMAACPGTKCVTGSLSFSGRNVPTIFLSPGEDSEGHVITARHEMAHALSACTSDPPSLDPNHRNQEVWALVWRR